MVLLPMESGPAAHPGEIIAEARKRLGMTQRDLSSATGISPGAIAMVEYGKRYPNLETIQRLAPALNMTVKILPSGITEWVIDGVLRTVAPPK